MKRVVWSALLIVLIEASPTDAIAQSFVCYAMTRGESATQAARRVTGNDQNAYQQWFQILDASSRFVPKSQYNRIRAGWRACVVKPAIRSVSSNAHRVEKPGAAAVSEANDVSEALKDSDVPAVLAVPTALASAAAPERPQLAASGDLRRLRGVDLTMLWVCAALVVPWFGWRI